MPRTRRRSSAKKKEKHPPFEGFGLGIKKGQQPVGVKLPPEQDAIVRSLPNRSEFLREAIALHLKRKKLI